jgi:hypothetical protein
VGISVPKKIPRLRESHVTREEMPFPIKTCVVCEEEFELKPGKPGFANRCPKCSVPEEDEDDIASDLNAGDREANEARRKAIRDLLYRKES